MQRNSTSSQRKQNPTNSYGIVKQNIGKEPQTKPMKGLAPPCSSLYSKDSKIKLILRKKKKKKIAQNWDTETTSIAECQDAVSNSDRQKI